MLLRDLSKEGATEADQEREDQEGYKEEGESCNHNCDVTVMLFSCYMILLWFY